MAKWTFIRLEDLLMSNRIPIVVLTGAGASRANPISLPTMTEFFQQIMDERVPTSDRISNPAFFKFIFDTLYGEGDNYDLERVMGALYSLSDFTNSDCWSIFQHPDIYNKIVYQLGTIHKNFRDNSADWKDKGLEVVKDTVKQSYQDKKGDAHTLLFELECLIREKYEHIPNEHIRSVYEPLFEYLLKNAINSSEEKAPLIPFFTTNYDMSVDWFFNPAADNDITIQEKWEGEFSKKLDFVDGFVGKRKRFYWDQKDYDRIDESNTGNIYIPYFKLHGSLYWEKVAGSVRIGTNVVNDPYYPRELMLIYPSDKKVLYDDPYYFNHRMLESYLRRTDYLLVIGFSFRDPEISRIIESNLLFNKNLKVIFIGPEYDENYFPELHRFLQNDRVKHLEGYFGNNDVIEKLKSSYSQYEFVTK
jgi:hypothetical protein